MKRKNNVVKKIVSELEEAVQSVRNSSTINHIAAFKLVFSLFAYKRLSGDSRVGFEWDQLVNCPTDEFLTRLLNDFMALSEFHRLRPIDWDGYLTRDDVGLSVEPIQVIDWIELPKQITDNTKEHLVKVFENMELSDSACSRDQLDEIISNFIENCFLKHSPDSFENRSLNTLALEILNPDLNDTVYFPECGVGDVLIQSDNQSQKAKYYEENFSDIVRQHFIFHTRGTTRNFDILPIIALRLLLLIDLEAVDVVSHNDYPFFTTPNPEVWGAKREKEFYNAIDRLYSGKLRLAQDRLFDDSYDSHDEILNRLLYLANVIFLACPFGLQVPSDLPEVIRVRDYIFEISQDQPELYLLLQSLKNLYKKRGRVGIVLPSTVLHDETGDHKEVRKLLIDEDILEAIIQLPTGLFSGLDNNLVLLIINVEKPEDKRDRFAFIKVNAIRRNGIATITRDSIKKALYVYRNFVSLSDDCVATVNDIRKMDYNLLPLHYLEPFTKEIKDIRRLKTGRQLGEIARIVTGRLTPSEQSTKGIPVITKNNLTRDVKELYLNFEGISYGKPTSSDQAIKEKCIIVSLIGGDLRPTIFDPAMSHNKQNNPSILLGKDVAAIFPATNVVDFDYLYYQLNSSLVKTQFIQNITGTAIPKISPSRLENILVPLLDKIEEQKMLAYQQKIELFKAEDARYESLREILQIKDEKKEAEFQIVRHLGHSLNRRIGNVESIVEQLKNFIHRKGLYDEALQEIWYEGQETILVKDKIKIALDDLRQMHKLIASTRELVTKGMQELTAKDFRSVNVYELFRDRILPKYQDHDFQIEFHCPQKVMVLLHEVSFVEAIDNIIRNAEDHGFKNSSTGNKIFFWIRDANDQIQIDYANNGIPFPSDMSEDDFLKFGEKSQSSNGSGLGGAYVKLMLEVHNARLQIISDNRDVVTERAPHKDRGKATEFGVFMRITIPKRRYDEQ